MQARIIFGGGCSGREHAVYTPLARCTLMAALGVSKSHPLPNYIVAPMALSFTVFFSFSHTIKLESSASWYQRFIFIYCLFPAQWDWTRVVYCLSRFLLRYKKEKEDCLISHRGSISHLASCSQLTQYTRACPLSVVGPRVLSY